MSAPVFELRDVTFGYDARPILEEIRRIIREVAPTAKLLSIVRER